jgi:hypothetical protein
MRERRTWSLPWKRHHRIKIRQLRAGGIGAAHGGVRPCRAGDPGLDIADRDLGAAQTEPAIPVVDDDAAAKRLGVPEIPSQSLSAGPAIHSTPDRAS